MKLYKKPLQVIPFLCCFFFVATTTELMAQNTAQTTNSAQSTQPYMVAGQVVSQPNKPTTPVAAANGANNTTQTNQIPASAPAANTANPTTNIKTDAANLNPLLVQQQDPKLLERVTQLEKNNQDILTKNQQLELENDNLATQVKLLQGDQGIKLFVYGAIVFALGIVMGIVLTHWLKPKNKPW